MKRQLVRALRRHFPYLGVEALDTAVQTVSAVVLRQLVVLAVQGKTAVFDTVGYTSADGIEIGLLGAPLVCGLEAQHDIFHFAFAVGNEQLGDLRTQVTDLHFQATAALDGIKTNRFHIIFF